MIRPRSSRAHRVAVPDVFRRADAEASWRGSAFAVATGGDPRSAEQWARSCFEGAPTALRWSVVVGWQLILRLRLGPRDSPDHVLGWKVLKREPDTITLEACSAFLIAHKVVYVEAATLTVATFVSAQRWYGRWIWSLVSPVHHVLEPLLLTCAARSASQ